jgi:sarcosine oxidase, subunit beta
VRALREQDTVWQATSGRPLPSCSISNAVDAIYLRPQGDGRYVIGRGFPKEYFDVDPYNYKETADEEFVAEVRERSWRRVPALAGATLLHSYAALYDVTPDWYPFIGPRAGLEGYVDACGGSGHGFKIAPAIGRELADWIVDGKAADDFAALSHDRVGAGKLFSHSYGGNRG